MKHSKEIEVDNLTTEILKLPKDKLLEARSRIYQSMIDGLLEGKTLFPAQCSAIIYKIDNHIKQGD